MSFATPMPPFIRELRDAIREGRKTETRRVVKNVSKPCPYGKWGQRKYLREPLVNVKGWAHYADDLAPVGVRWRWQVNKLSQLYMPSSAARTFLMLGRVSYEPVQDISGAAAIREGIKKNGNNFIPPGQLYSGRNEKLGPACGDARTAFVELWDAINGERSGGRYAWKNNPIVWVICFKLI